MKAWRLHTGGKLIKQRLEPLSPPNGFVKVKLLYAALSKTDAMLLKGNAKPSFLPITIGHQAVGIVGEVGEGVTNVERGDRVVLDPYVYCLECAELKDAKCSECAELKTYGVHQDGFMSDFVTIACNNVYKLPERVSSEEALFSSHVAFAINIFNKLQIKPGEHVLVYGASVVGIILAQIALYYQAIPILVDMRDERLEIAESSGIYYCINSIKEDVKERIFTVTGGSMPTVVAYFPSSDNALNKCLDYATSGARICISSWSGADINLTGSFDAVLKKQLSVFGVSNGAKLIAPAINMLANKTVDVTNAISGVIAFDEVSRVLAEQIKHPDKNIKLLVKF